MAGEPIRAVEMAKRAGIDPRRFRKALRKMRFPWHHHNDPWTVEAGSDRYREMEEVLNSLL